VVQVTSLECGGCISASTSLSLSIEGVCSELVQMLCFRFSRGGVARVRTGHLSLIRLTYRPIKTRLLVPCTQTRRRRRRGRKREGVLAHTWRIKLVLSTQGIVYAFSPPNPQFLRLSTVGQDAEQQHRKKASCMLSHFMREASSLRNALRTVSIMD
jgi:hypothetical protein